MKKFTAISFINRIYSLLAIAAITLLASCSKVSLQDGNMDEPPKPTSPYAVSYNEAMAELESLLADIDTPTKGKSPRKVANYYTTPISGAETKSNADAPFIYVFNFENNEGFAILSGDKRTTPVYAITESGSLNPGDTITNPGLGIALMGINDDIWGKEELDPPGNDVYTFFYSPWRNSIFTGNYYEVAWGQREPYNKYCPNGCPTGCTATAIAQIMFYHEYPSQYGQYSFNWIAMREKYYYDKTNHYAYDMIARLMQQLGLPNNLNTEYNSDISYALNEDVSRTFRNFGYSNGGTISAYNFDRLKTELIAGYPVYVSGHAIKITPYLPWQQINYKGGHTWVINYIWERERTVTTHKNGIFFNEYIDYNKLVYCNWGWDGNDSNGFYYSGIFNIIEGSANDTKISIGEDYNFQFNHQMITGIRR